MKPNLLRSWEGFLDPEVLRPRLIAASMFIAGFEALKDVVVERIRDFFCMGLYESGENTAPKYESDVRARNRSVVYASLDWLQEMHAIDDADLDAFNRVKACRNALAHELLAMLEAGGLPDDFGECFAEMVALLQKIDVWWITNFEIPVNSDLDGLDVDEEEIVPGPVTMMQVLYDIALGNEERCRLYYNDFRKRTGGS